MTAYHGSRFIPPTDATSQPAIVPVERKAVVESEMPDVGVRISACYVSGAHHTPYMHYAYLVQDCRCGAPSCEN